MVNKDTYVDQRDNGSLYIRTNLNNRKCIIVDLEGYGDVIIFWTHEGVKAVASRGDDMTTQVLAEAKDIIKQNKHYFEKMISEGSND